MSWAHAVEANQALPRRMKFCHLSALDGNSCPDLIKTYQQKPVSIASQHLLAFSGDVWHIAQPYPDEPNLKSIAFYRHTRLIQISHNQITPIPQCFKSTQNGVHLC